jgi:hypothetical protein
MCSCVVAYTTALTADGCWLLPNDYSVPITYLKKG